MITIGCAGFPVPATRYFKELLFVEVQDTQVAQPGSGTLRRWRREAPSGFAFSVLAPKDIGNEGFRDGKIAQGAVRAVGDVARELDAHIAVFPASPEYACSRANKTAVREFLGGVKKKFQRVVWEPPPPPSGWDARDAQTLAAECGAVAARDPLASGTSDAPFAYYRLPGPAGHKSRYEDHAIERLAGLLHDAKEQQAIVVFTNVDMFSDAKRLRQALDR